MKIYYLLEVIFLSNFFQTVDFVWLWNLLLLSIKLYTIINFNIHCFPLHYIYLQIEWLTAGDCLAGMHEVIVTSRTIDAIKQASEQNHSLWRVSSTVSLPSHIIIIILLANCDIFGVVLRNQTFLDSLFLCLIFLIFFSLVMYSCLPTSRQMPC